MTAAVASAAMAAMENLRHSSCAGSSRPGLSNTRSEAGVQMGSCLANMAAAGAAGWGALGGLSAVDREVVVVVDEEEPTVAEMATVVAAREWAAAAVVLEQSRAGAVGEASVVD